MKKFKLTSWTLLDKRIMPPSETTTSGCADKVSLILRILEKPTTYWVAENKIKYQTFRSGEGFLCVFSITEEDSFQVMWVIDELLSINTIFICNLNDYGQWQKFIGCIIALIYMKSLLILNCFLPNRRHKSSESRFWESRATTTFLLSW